MANRVRVYWVELEVPQAPSNTYAKSGGISSEAKVGGDRAYQVARSGGTTSPASTGASRVVVHSKSGGMSSAASTGATRSHLYVKSSGDTSAASLGATRNTQVNKSVGFQSVLVLGGTGSRATRVRVYWIELETPAAPSNIYPKSGGIQSAGVLSGTRGSVFVFNKTGGIVSTARMGATQHGTIVGPWSATETFSLVAQPQKSGGTRSPLLLGGVRNTIAAKVAGYVSAIVMGATKRVTFDKSSGIQSGGSLGATVLKVVIHAKSGGISSAGSVGATASQAYPRQGGLVSTPQTGATRLTQASKMGGNQGAGSLGADLFVVYGSSKVGIISSAVGTGAEKGAVFSKTGGISSGLSTGDLVSRREGGMVSAASVGGARVIFIAREGGIVSGAKVGGALSAFVSKEGGIVSSTSTGGGGALAWPKDGGIASAGSMSADWNVPERRYEVDGGISSTGSLGASQFLTMPRTGGLSIALRLGEMPSIKIRSAGVLGGTVSTRRTAGALHLLVGAELDEGVVLTTDEDMDAVLIGATVAGD